MYKTSKIAKNRFGSVDKSVGLWAERSQVQFWSRACTLVAGTYPVGDVQEAAGRCFSFIDVSNSLSLPLCKKNQ